MADLFCEPSAEQLVATTGLAGKRISLWWDGDAIFFSAKVVDYESAGNIHNVRYDNDDSYDLYSETLSKQPWKIWGGSEDEFRAYNKVKVEETKAKAALQDSDGAVEARSSSSSMKMSYSVMAVEAVLALAERHGSSLVAIRKYIQANYPLKQQQTASFNSLTLKGVSKAVAMNELERLKHSYKVTSQEKDKRKERERKASYIASGRGTKDLKHQKKKGSKGKKGSKSSKSASAYGYYYAGSAAETNRPRRRDMERLKERRDEYLEGKKELLLHFLTDNDYFKKKEKREKKGIEKEEKKKKDEAVAAAVLGDMISSSSDHTNHTDHTNHNSDNANSSLDDAASAMAALCGIAGIAAENIEVQAESVENNVKVEVSEDPQEGEEGVSPGSEVTPTESELAGAKHVNWNNKLEEEPIENGENGVAGDSEKSKDSSGTGDDDEDDTNIEPPELQVSCAMRGVPLVAQPPTLIAELHEHQIQGISWMAHMFSHGMPMILGDQMGLGKTIQSIGLLAHLQSALGQGGPHLVVVPLSVLSNWLTEIERFCPSMRAVRFHGPKAERNRIKTEELADTTEFDIVVTTFEILVSEVNFFKRKYVWTTIIVDEGHRLKNEKSQLSEKLRSVSCLSKIILTGTPLQNNLKELWALLHFLASDVFTPATAEKFETGFDLVKGLVDSRLLRRARKLLGVFMLRRVKDQVAISLPSRRELTVLVPLTDRQVEWYKRLLCGLDSDVIETVMRESVNVSTPEITENGESESNVAAIVPKLKGKKNKESTPSSSSSGASGSGDSDWRKLMNLLLQLRKICNHIYLMPDAAPDPYDVGEHVVGGSGKLLMLDRMLPRLRQDGHRVLLFSQFTSMLDLLEDYCELRDLPYVRLDGETNRVQRRLDVRRFNAPNSPLFIFLISTRAGGLGLNLASADTVILYDSDWNPQVDLQAMERAHRIGQVKPVRVYRLVCSGSVEERMVSRAEKKLFLNAMVAETDPDELEEGKEGELDEGEDENQALGIGGATMSKGELASLIRFGANAVFESAGNTQISDKDLDKLLERQGRDKPSIPNITVEVLSISLSSSSSSDKSSASASAAAAAMSTGLAMDDLEAVQAALRDRMELLTEVDLRQLGDTLYTRRKGKAKNEGIDVKNIVGRGHDDGEVDLKEFTSNKKRQRKERVIMVDGKGTGYGGAVPVLVDSMDKPPAPAVISRHRSRAWTHMTFCAFCARSKCTETNTICKCAHCPRVFHTDCMEERGIPKGTGMFICPHHKCASCNRSTAAAGGLLFRCMGCLTSYCEDCLPQDEIESVGRCRSMEDLGYESKQSYYIICPSCCLQDGVTAKGVVGDQVASVDGEDADEEGDDDDEDEDDGEVVDKESKESRKKEVEIEAQLLPTQLMRVMWDEEPDSEEERERKAILSKSLKKTEKDRIKKEAKEAEEAYRLSKEAKGRGRGKAAPAPVAASRGKKSAPVEESDEESEEEEEVEVKPKNGKNGKAINGKGSNGIIVKPAILSRSSRVSTGKTLPPVSASVAGRSKKKEVVQEESEEEEDSYEDEEEEESSDEDDGYRVRIPVRCELGDALNILLAHPRAIQQNLGVGGGDLLSSSMATGPSSSNVTLNAIQTKLASGRYRSVLPFVSDVRAFLNSFKTKSSTSKGGKAAAPVAEEISPLKRRRFPVQPAGSMKRMESIDDPEVAKANIEALLEYFNERLVVRLAIL